MTKYLDTRLPPWFTLNMNTHCPDPQSHWQNAADRMFPEGTPEFLTAEQSEAVDADAETEYRHCEGH